MFMDPVNLGASDGAPPPRNEPHGSKPAVRGPFMVRHHFQSSRTIQTRAGGRGQPRRDTCWLPQVLRNEQITYLSQTFPDPVAANAADSWAGVGGKTLT